MMREIKFDDNGYALCPHPAHPSDDDDDERALTLTLLYSCAVYDDMDEDPEAATSIGAITSGWRVECGYGHVMAVPSDSDQDHPKPFRITDLMAQFSPA